jgi:hypothetical protein
VAAPTVAQARAVLVTRLGVAVTQAGLPVAPAASPDALDDALLEAITFLGVVPANPTAPADGDLVNVDNLLATDPFAWRRFLDVAELRLLETAAVAITGKYEEVALPDVTRRRSVAAFGRYLDGKRKAAKERWGFGLAVLGGGEINPRKSGGLYPPFFFF